MKTPSRSPFIQFFDRLKVVSIPARKLFAVIVREAYHGPIRPKAKGTATPPEILEACGLDVGEFYGLLEELKSAGLIRIASAYPFEEITLSAEAAEAESLAEQCTREKIPFEEVCVNLVTPTSKYVVTVRKQSEAESGESQGVGFSLGSCEPPNS